MIKIKLDENLSNSILEVLRKHNIDTESVYSQGLQGIEDSILWEIVTKEKRLFITLDIGFIDIRKVKNDHCGIIIIRIRKNSPRRIKSIIVKILKTINLDNLKNKLVIAEENRLRIKKTK